MNAIAPITVANEDVVQAAREAALLADVTISMWGAERSDHAAMEKVKVEAGAVGNVGRVVKNMLAGVDGKLRDTRSAFAAVRSLHYGMTLPYVTDPHAKRQRGPRLLPKLLFEKYLGALSAQKRTAMTALDAFIDEYPDLIGRAKANLGGLADARYPLPDEVRGAFRVSFDFEPIPAGAGFHGLSDRILERLSHGLQAKQARMIEGATTAMWQTVRERVGHIVERLSDQDTKFKSSTVETVRELVTLLPAWGFADSDRAREVATDIERMLAGVDPKALRDNVQVRADVVEQARAVVEKMSAWGL